MNHSLGLRLFPLLVIIPIILLSACQRTAEPGGVLRLTPGDRFSDTTPTWLGRGRILFTRLGTGLLTMNPDGRDLQQVPNTHGREYCASESPDGKNLAFTDVSGTEPIAVMSENGNDRRFLENAPKQSECPRWSPDGTRLAFSSMVSGKSQLFVIKVDGSNLTQLTASPQSSYVHAWEPNGERIAYVDETSSDIYLVSSNGGTPVRVTSDGQFKGWTPAWSSDGKWIVYSSHGIDANHPPGFYAIHPDGSGRRLLFEFGGAMDAAISRTGDLLAFWAITGSEGSQASGIFVKNLRGLLQ